jgi:hypothetical protein
MNESQARLAYFIMTHFPADYENALDAGESVCDVALKIIMRLSQHIPDGAALMTRAGSRHYKFIIANHDYTRARRKSGT